MTDAAPAVARAAARGAVWSYATFVVSKGLTLATTLVLARLLDPVEFGLIGIALVFMGYLDVLNDFGIVSAVIWRRGDIVRTARVAYGLNLGIGAVLSLLSLALAPIAASFYREPRLAGMLAALSATFLLASLGSVQDALLRRALAFRRRFLAEAIKASVKAAAVLLLAANGAGAWSVVLGQIAGVCAGAAAYWALAGWRPGVIVDRALTGQLLAYGGQLTLLGLLAMMAGSVDQIVIGRRLGAAALGFYVVAFRLPSLLVMQSCSVVSQVLFPAFARVQHRGGSLAEPFLRALRTLAAITLPLGLGIALVAPELVSVLFGDRWRPAAPLMRLLALHTVLLAMLYNDGDVYKAAGRPGVLNVMTGLQVAVTAPVTWWAAGRSAMAVATAMVLVSGATMLLRAWVVRRLLALPDGALTRALGPVVLSGVAMAGTVLVVRIGLDGASATTRLVASVVVGISTYLSVLALVAWPWLRETADLFARRRSPAAPSVAASPPA